MPPKPQQKPESPAEPKKSETPPKKTDSPKPKAPPEKPAPAPPEKKMPPPAKKPPTPKNSEVLKYSMTYANGGFNNGIEIKPGKDGKLELSIAIYGGGEKKTLGIGNLPQPIIKLLKAYETSALDNEPADEIIEGLRKYFTVVNQVLALKIIKILQDADSKIKDAIQDTFKEIK